MKVAVYAPMKNERSNIEGWCESAQEADVLVLADTGSDDGSEEQALLLMDTHPHLNVYRICIDPWRFDTAYNTVLALVPEDIDIAVCLNLDERLQPGWREELEQRYDPEAGVYLCHYEFAPGLTYRHGRIHNRHNVIWRLPAHEYPDSPGHRVDTNVRIVQNRSSRDRTSDSALIFLAYEETPCARTAYYAAREYSYLGNWQSARDLFQKYLDMPDATFGQERAEACRFMSRMVWPLQREKWLLRACSEAPKRRECWGELAEHYQTCGDYQGTKYAAMRALRIKTAMKDNSFHLESKYWDDTYLRGLFI